MIRIQCSLLDNALPVGKWPVSCLLYRAEIARLQRIVELKTKEMNKVKRLAKNILDQVSAGSRCPSCHVTDYMTTSLNSLQKFTKELYFMTIAKILLAFVAENGVGAILLGLSWIREKWNCQKQVQSYFRVLVPDRLFVRSLFRPKTLLPVAVYTDLNVKNAFHTQ